MCLVPAECFPLSATQTLKGLGYVDEQGGKICQRDIDLCLDSPLPAVLLSQDPGDFPRMLSEGLFSKLFLS